VFTLTAPGGWKVSAEKSLIRVTQYGWDAGQIKAGMTAVYFVEKPGYGNESFPCNDLSEALTKLGVPVGLLA
jgi:hypothetical protein